MKIFECQQLYLILGKAELDNMSVDEKYKVITLAREFKKISQDFEDFIKDSQENIKDSSELNLVIDKEANRSIETSYTKLSKEVFDKLITSNTKWNVAQLLMLEDFIKE